MQNLPSSGLYDGLDEYDSGKSSFGALPIEQARQLNLQLVDENRRCRCICLGCITSWAGERDLAAGDMAKESWSEAWKV